ncbi:anthranilate synthase component II [Vibrio mangrovi]|uniref:Aminodeoxychorismate/anthranilate synthase component 2 n=1 Tax=Vibrio mangrovi TaxID=474394 RepID=A0A1Y6IPV6_9VIBR|nr:aminodeoxychorismate/anthranilate synthase component II [Vibrio mangrovi]MDW6003517.1 aminodeoxychorismate/anthranilate synthase component II [Vibrio mangrovi]SMR99689.1 Aminodeoxychorismate/anthranilate synthase component 2 [Vibrio mangrovi]
MKVLLVDAFDSFVYVIEHYYSALGVETQVVRVNEDPLTRYREWQPDLLVLGPGPGTPQEHGYFNLLKNIDSSQPVFGVCLGHQAIGEYFGWQLTHAPTVQHGKFSNISHDGKGVFSGLPNPMRVVRYHSLVLQCSDRSNEIYMSAYDTTENNVMALRHRDRPIEGVQFHPESIGTEDGLKIIQNSLKLVSMFKNPKLLSSY